MNRTAALSVVASLMLSGCSVLGIGGSVGPNEWWLTGTTPDGQQLLVTSMFGGVASGCSRWEGWEVDTSAEQVEVMGLLWRKHRPSGCTDDGASRTLLLDLDAPLGERTLEGCQRDDCRTESFPEWLGGDVAQAMPVEEGVVVSDGAFLRSFGSDGLPRWETSAAPGSQLLATSDVVVTSDGSGTVARDATSGDRRWNSSGHPIVAAEGVVITCEDDQVRGLDAASGVERWTAAAPCGPAAVSGTTVAMVFIDREVDGGHELVMFDIVDGRIATQRDLEDGVDDRVAAYSGVLAFGSRFVVAGTQANLVVLDTTGTELERVPSVEGHPIGVADGVAVLATHDTVTGVDLRDGAELWSEPTNAWMSWAVADSAVLVLDGPTGELSRIDVRRGQPTWSTQAGSSTGLAASTGSSGVLYVQTVLALLLIDQDSGEVISWSRTPPAVDEVRTGE